LLVAHVEISGEHSVLFVGDDEPLCTKAAMSELSLAFFSVESLRELGGFFRLSKDALI
jgi:hypothetical protein